MRVSLRGGDTHGAPLSVRVGPFPVDTQGLTARVDNRPVECRMEKSGRAVWGWVEIEGGAERMVRVERN